MFCFKTISDPSLLLSFRRSCCSLSGPDSWPLSCNWPLIPHPPPLDIFFLLDATKRDGARRDASMSAVMLLRSWLDSLGSVVCPDVLDSHSAWEQEKRNDWDQASSWGGILAWIWHHGAELIDRRLWEFFYLHSCTTTGNQAGRGCKYFEQASPRGRAWISARKTTEVPAHLWEDGVRSRG